MGLPAMEKVQFACTVIALPLYAVTLFFNYASSDSSLGKQSLAGSSLWVHRSVTAVKLPLLVRALMCRSLTHLYDLVLISDYA